MINIANPIQHIRILITDLARAKGRHIRMGLGCDQQVLQPVWFRKGIWIQKGNILGGTFPECAVIAGRKPRIHRHGDEDFIFRKISDTRRTIGAGVIHDTDPLGRNALAPQMIQTAAEQTAAVEIDDDDGY